MESKKFTLQYRKDWQVHDVDTLFEIDCGDIALCHGW